MVQFPSYTGVHLEFDNLFKDLLTLGEILHNLKLESFPGHPFTRFTKVDMLQTDIKEFCAEVRHLLAHRYNTRAGLRWDLLKEPESVHSRIFKALSYLPTIHEGYMKFVENYRNLNAEAALTHDMNL